MNYPVSYKSDYCPDPGLVLNEMVSFLLGQMSKWQKSWYAVGKDSDYDDKDVSPDDLEDLPMIFFGLRFILFDRVSHIVVI